MSEELKIIGLKAQDILNIESIDIKPDGKTVILSGDNGTGKSNRIDCVFMALTGKKPEKPIMDGKDKGEIVIDMGKYVVRKVFTEKDTYLEVKSPEGAKYPSPQNLLNNIIGELSFDPGKFFEMNDKEQRKQLASLVGLDFSELDMKRQAFYDDRTFKNRELNALKNRLEAETIPDPNLPTEEISLSVEMEKVNDLREKRSEFLNVISKREEEKQSLTNNINKIQELERSIEQLKNENVQIEKNINAYIIPQEITEAQILAAENELKEIESKNRLIQAAKNYFQLKADLKNAQDAVDSLTQQIKDLDASKAQQIQQVRFPVEGLGLTDECVTYNNLPLSQASDGEQLKIAVAISMKLNPSLRVIFLKKASLIGKQNLEVIVKMAETEGYQLWLEKVSDDQEVKVVIQ